MKLNVHRFLPHTTVEGPGERACLWVQGCPIHCKGCAVPWTWPEEGGTEMEIEALARVILTGPTVEGVTFLGGEPFAQAAPLAQLATILRSHGLSVMTFSGFTLESIQRANRADWQALLEVTDLLIDGPFQEELLDLSRPWVGSANQRYHFLTERYRHLASELSQIPNRLEVRIHPDGTVLINGLASNALISEIF